MSLGDDDLARYSRHLLLPEIDLDGQARLAAARVLVVGVGGLGSPVALYLAAAGVGRLVLVDPDVVDLSNLQRQIVHGTADVGRAKVDSARDRVAALNPHVTVATHAGVLDGEGLRREVAAATVVVDGSDNYPTRFAVNAAAFAAGVPLVSAAVIRFEGQLAVFDPRRPESPCYRCLYDDLADGEAERCERAGVLAALPGVLGSLQAVETLKLILGIGAVASGWLLVHDALTGDWRRLRLNRDPHCPVCAGRPAR